MNLAKLGWNDWFERAAQCAVGDTKARVVAVDRDQLLLNDGEEIFRAKLAGNFYFHHTRKEEFPCVGDFVCVEKHQDADYAVIHSVITRKTAFRRKVIGADVEVQMIAANVDYVVVVQSCHFDFNVKRLERYLVMVQEGGAEPIILLTKTDLVATEDLEEKIAAISSAGIQLPIYTLSNFTGEGVNDFKNRLKPGCTYCFVGSSGVGKSTLINQLAEKDVFATQGVSDSGEGKHTTVRRELILLDSGALIIDNPGMREFGLVDATNAIDDSFADIAQLAKQCRFNDCSHTSEPKCAVREALASGVLNKTHFENYLKLQKETSFHELTKLEKRQKDKSLGKLYRSVKKEKSLK